MLANAIAPQSDKGRNVLQKSPAGTKKSKRQASRSRSRERGTSRKVRRVEVGGQINPTLLTWMTAAGVVVLVSALSFSTGYVIGKEDGIMEARMHPSTSLPSGASVGRSMDLKRLRWSSSTAVVA